MIGLHPTARVSSRALRTVASCAAACAVLFPLASVGCSHQDRMKTVTAAYTKGQYPVAAAEIEPLLQDRRDSEKDRTLYELEAGQVYAAAADAAKSTEALRTADERMWEYLDDAPEIRVSATAAAILSNQTVIPYVGRTYDRIMCCSYLGLNHLAAGDLEAAAVSFKRAYEWQRDAVEKNAKEIEALEKEAGAKGTKDNYNAEAARSDPKTKAGFDSAYGPLENMTGYSNYAIPYATYLQALQQTLTSQNADLEQATFNFRRTAEMLPEAARTYAADDAARAEAATRGAALKPHVHVLVETGMGPRLDELRIDIPLFMRQYPYAGAAFPVMKFNEGAVSGFTARAGGSSYPSALLTDMDRVVADEFKQRLPAIIALTIVSTATKMIATYAAQQAAMNSGDRNAAWAIAIGLAIYQASVNNADLRIWLTLPKQVLYASFPAPAEGPVEIDLGDGQKIGPIEVESTGATIVHVRSPNMGAAPVVRTMRFPAK